MLVLTFQDKGVLRKLQKGCYFPSLMKSEYAHASVEFTMGYNKILNELSKIDYSLLEGDSCLWAWVHSPADEMVQLLVSEDKVAIYMDVDEKKVVFSDYDKYTNFVLGDSDDMDFILDDVEDIDIDGMCIQCSFTPSAIKRIVTVYTCGSFVVYPEISRCMYYQMLSSNVSAFNKTIYDKTRVIYNNIKYSWSNLLYSVKNGTIVNFEKSNVSS